jgi:DNA primase
MAVSGRISDDLIEEIRANNDIVGLISEYVPLKRQGKNYVGLCPFHQEKKPSFSVSSQRQIFHCFGCGIGGNVYKFLMEYQKMGFLDAVKYLAERANITLPARTLSTEGTSEYEPLYKANHLAAAHYHQQLLESIEAERARQYLKKRGFSEDIIKSFRLGYAPPGWDGLIKRAGRHSISPEVLFKAGLALKKDFGEGYYDRFRDRLIFPITNVSGKFIAFGGRIMGDGDEVKYINSPETPIYQKGRTLYGLFQSKEAIRKSGTVVIVEGYTDVLSLFQAGISNVVASLGTSLTSHQARLISRYAQEAVIVYDADSAGVAAAHRGLDLLLATSVAAQALSLPPGKDPDQVVREKGGDYLAKGLQNAESFLDFKLRHLRQKTSFSSVKEKAEAIEEMGRTISLIEDPIRRGLYLREVAEKMGVDEKLVVLAVQKVSPRRRGRPEIETQVREVVHRGSEWAERRILALLLQNPKLVPSVRMRLSVDDFKDENHRRVAGQLLEADEEEAVEPAKLMNSLTELGLESLISELCFLEERGQVERLLEDYMRNFEGKRLLREEQRVKEQLREAEKGGDEALVDQLTRRLSQIAQQRYRSTSASS